MRINKALKIVVSFLLMFLTINMQSSRADSPSTPKGVSDALWQAYQSVALIDPSKLLFQPKSAAKSASSNVIQYVDSPLASSEPKTMKWRSAPYVVASGGPLDWDIKGIKSAVSEISQFCSDMKPQYVTPIVTTSTVVSRRGTSTVKSIWPNFTVIYFQYAPPATFIKVLPWVTSNSDITDSNFTYDLTGAFITTKTLISNVATTQKQRDLIVKRSLLQAMGLQGITSNKDSKAFSGDSNWDGTFSVLDKQIIALQCNAKVPTYSTAQQVADSLNS